MSMRLVLIYNTVGGLKKFQLEQPTITIGALPSNHLVLAGKGVDPIHGLIEKQADGSWKISDLGSEFGIKVGGKKIDVEADLRRGDKLKIGTVELHLESATAVAATPGEEGDASAAPAAMAPAAPAVSSLKPTSSPRLFDVQPGGRAGGKVLEIVAYWGDRVLEIEHYYKPSEKPRSGHFQSEATMGLSSKADFIAAGPHKITEYVFARTTEKGYTVKLFKGMEARLRRDGKIKRVNKPGKFKLSTRDIADIKYGPIRYFLLYVKPPKLKIPKHSPRDPLFLALLFMGLILFITTLGTVTVIDPPPDKDSQRDDIWSIVGLSQEVKKPKVKKEEPPKPKKQPVKLKKKEPEKKKVIIPEAKPQPKLKPEPKKVVAKPKPQRVIKKPQVKSQLSQLKPPTPKAIDTVTKNKPLSQPVAAAAPTTAVRSKLTAGGGGSAKKGGGGPGVNTLRGGSRHGSAKTKTGAAGVEGVSNNKASGVNLAQLGQSAGKIFNKAGAGAIQTNFQSSGGGLGGGSGSASSSRRSGLGGNLTQSSAVGLSGSTNQISTFGAGGGGLLDKGTGTGGFSTGSGAGRGLVNVHVDSAGPPGVQGGLSASEVSGVMRTNNNQIRNCYEKLLKQKPNVTGKVKIKIVIAPSGGVMQGGMQIVENGIGDRSIEDCILDKVKTWRFPKPRGGQKVEVNFPWIFRPS